MASKWIGSRWEKREKTGSVLSGVIVGEVTIAGKLGPYKNLVIRYNDGAEANTTLAVLRTYFKMVPEPSGAETLFGLLPPVVASCGVKYAHGIINKWCTRTIGHAGGCS